MTDDSKNRLIRLALYLFVGLIFFLTIIYGSIEKPPYGFIIIISISTVFMSLARILKGTWKFKRMLLFSKTIGFIGLFNMLLFPAIVWFQNSTVKSNSTRLISVIEQYKFENGKYPKKLNDLTPRYIKEIPKVWIGFIRKDFMYNNELTNDLENSSQNNGLYFYIAYNMYFGEICIYNNKDKNWTRK